MMKHFKPLLFAILVIIACVAANNEANISPAAELTSERAVLRSAPTSVGLCEVVPTSQEPMKLLVPLYIYPGPVWDQIIEASSTVPTMVVINPNTGPTAVPNSDYATYMNKLQNAGIEMIGYVHTSYGTRSIDDVKSDIDIYAATWPLLKGIFLDEASSYDSDLPYYTQAYNHIVSKGYAQTILNPGTQPTQGYLAISTSIIIFEQAGELFNQNAQTFSSFVACAPSASAKSGYKYKFAAVAHSTQSSSASALMSSMQQQGVGLVYVTDQLYGCCTYNTLVSYYSSEAASIQAMN